MLKIHLVTPPFAGHLFPLLALGEILQNKGYARVQVLSTNSARRSIELMGLEFVPLLENHDAAIEAIANPSYQVKVNPLRLLKQFEANLSLMLLLKEQLYDIWSSNKPDLLIADSVLPIAGFLAQEMDITWWTSIATPCAIETQSATPSYLGGWTPQKGWVFDLRDAIGRRTIRAFKQFVAWFYAERFKTLKIPKLYRANGEEAIYSDQKIVALGMQEFEFTRDWPAALEFLGPITKSPPFEQSYPVFNNANHHVLVSLGTHLPWAKDNALAFIKKLATTLNDCCFHFTFGRDGSECKQVANNVFVYDYLAYDPEYMSKFKAAIIHGGTGITYSCIQAAVPMLIWPHDYDQFDHAARIVHYGLGLRLNLRVSVASSQLCQLFDSREIRMRLQEFQLSAQQYKPLDRILELVEDHLN